MTVRCPPPGRTRIEATRPEADEIVTVAAGTRLVRIHPTAGAHPVTWDEFRHWGPTGSRFDHHMPPPRTQERGILYATWDPDGARASFTAAVGEYFQAGDGAGVGPVDSALDAPAITVFDTATPLQLLDLDSGWVTRAGGNQAIRTGARGTARNWARAVYATFPDVVGFAYSSSVWGPGRCLALWERAAPAVPEHPAATRALTDAAIAASVAHACYELGTYTA